MIPIGISFWHIVKNFLFFVCSYFENHSFSFERLVFSSNVPLRYRFTSGLLNHCTRYGISFLSCFLNVIIFLFGNWKFKRVCTCLKSFLKYFSYQNSMQQLSEEAKKELEKQQYRVIGKHSAVKVCGWTKKMIKDEGGCYKLKFYGIMSSQCMQMTTSISCANRCSFCWRDYKAPVSKEWAWAVDEPDFIIENSIAAHMKLLTGFGGNPKTSRYMWDQSKKVGHVALS